MTTRYEVERAPGDGTAGFRVVAVTGDMRRAYLTRFQQREHAVEEMIRLKDRDAAIRQGLTDGFGRLTHQGQR